jgi:hypothetical protein
MSVWTQSEPKSLLARPFDLGLIIFFVLSMLYGFLISLPEALGVPVSADSPWPPMRGLYDWSVAQEPGHLQTPVPLPLVMNAFFDGFIQSPILLPICYGLWKQRTWVVPLGLFYAGASVLNMCFYFTQTFMGGHLPTNLASGKV